MFRCDLIWQNGAGGIGVHIAAPDSVQIERRLGSLHPQYVERIVGDVTSHPEVLRHVREILLLRSLSYSRQLICAGGYLIFCPTLDQRSVTVSRD